jgi:hypothetical protein
MLSLTNMLKREAGASLFAPQNQTGLLGHLILAKHQAVTARRFGGELPVCGCHNARYG